MTHKYIEPLNTHCQTLDCGLDNRVFLCNDPVQGKPESDTQKVTERVPYEIEPIEETGIRSFFQIMLIVFGKPPQRRTTYLYQSALIVLNCTRDQ